MNYHIHQHVYNLTVTLYPFVPESRSHQLPSITRTTLALVSSFRHSSAPPSLNVNFLSATAISGAEKNLIFGGALCDFFGGGLSPVQFRGRNFGHVTTLFEHWVLFASG